MFNCIILSLSNLMTFISFRLCYLSLKSVTYWWSELERSFHSFYILVFIQSNWLHGCTIFPLHWKVDVICQSFVLNLFCHSGGGNVEALQRFGQSMPGRKSHSGFSNFCSIGCRRSKRRRWKWWGCWISAHHTQFVQQVHVYTAAQSTSR